MDQTGINILSFYRYFREKKAQQLDDLTREELITKCRNLLAIAKKAKAAKDGELSGV